MIIQETFEWDGRMLVKTYSDKGYMIRQIETGYLYEEATDPVDMHREYEETDISVGGDEEISDSDALSIITGGEDK